MKFCPICGDILQLIEHQYPDGSGSYFQWECPEQDWFEPASKSEADKQEDE